MILETNTPAPDFTLPDQLGSEHSLSDYRGKPVLLYFYPKDDTSGCTTEACNFRDDYSAYTDAGVVVIGVSPDSPKSHSKFVLKYDLPFTLLADEDHAVCELYGVWGTKKMYGTRIRRRLPHHLPDQPRWEDCQRVGKGQTRRTQRRSAGVPGKKRRLSLSKPEQDCQHLHPNG